jgi:hypothetical protein
MFGTGLQAATIPVFTPSNRLALGMRFERFLAPFTALVDRFVAIVFASFDFLLGRGVVAVTNHSTTGVQFQSQRSVGHFVRGI